MAKTAHKIILENKLGERVRTFQVEGDSLTLIYRLDTRRIEGHSDLSHLDDQEIDYQIVEEVSAKSLAKKSMNLKGLGLIRLAVEDEIAASPTYELPVETDDEQLHFLMKKTAIGHLSAVAFLILFSLALGYFTQSKIEPQLVTIVIPEKETKKEEHVQVSEKKIAPTPVAHVNPKKSVATKTPKVAVKNVAKVTPKRTQPVAVHNAPERSLERVGALAALGGIKTGAKNAEGLDAHSLKNIRSAGVGQGGGGVGGAGNGGMRGMMPGTGLIAGSAGSGGRAQSAGGYGTKGAGGGKAGYGKISLVGGTSGVSLPLGEEPEVAGGLDGDQIKAVVDRNRGQIIYCYEQGLQAQPELRGRVSMQFVIGGSGRITTLKVAQSSLSSKLIEGCMVAKMKSWQFPRPIGHVNVDVVYPFSFGRVSSR